MQDKSKTRAGGNSGNKTTKDLPNTFQALADLLRVLLRADAEGKVCDLMNDEGLYDAFNEALGVAADVLGHLSSRNARSALIKALGPTELPIILDSSDLAAMGYTITNDEDASDWRWHHAESAVTSDAHSVADLAMLEATSSVLAAYSAGTPPRRKVVAGQVNATQANVLRSDATIPPQPQPDLGELLTDVLATMARMGFGTDLDINGPDTVDSMGGVYLNTIGALRGTALEPKVIYSASEDGFWCNINGWGDLATATHFYCDPTLPMSAGNDATLVPVGRAQEMLGA